MSEEEAYKIFSEMTPDVVDYVFSLAKAYTEKDKEIERLNKGYCPIKEKCNKGECDCTNEEYNQMCEENIKLDLEIERLNNIINKAIEYIETHQLNFKKGTTTFGSERLSMEERKLLDILKGVDKE